MSKKKDVLSEEQKIFKLVAMGLDTIMDNSEKLKELFPKSLIKNREFAKQACAQSLFNLRYFDRALLEDQDFVMYVLNAKHKEKENVRKGFRALQEDLEAFVSALPEKHLHDRSFVLQTLAMHPDIIFNWSAPLYLTDEEYQKVLVQKEVHFEGGVPIKHPIPYDLALKMCQSNALNYTKIQIFYPDDVELACAAVGAHNGSRVDINGLDKSIKISIHRLARVIASSVLKEKIYGYLEDKIYDRISNEVWRIDSNLGDLMEAQNVYKAARFICDRNNSKAETVALKKAMSKPVKKSVKGSALSKTL
jgi:hypothetical protein